MGTSSHCAPADWVLTLAATRGQRALSLPARLLAAALGPLASRSARRALAPPGWSPLAAFVEPGRRVFRRVGGWPCLGLRILVEGVVGPAFSTRREKRGTRVCRNLSKPEKPTDC
jgi:hypothetical protein